MLEPQTSILQKSTEEEKSTTLGELAIRVGSGVTPTGGSEVYTDTGVTFLRSQNVTNSGLRLDDVAFIDEATHQRMAASEVFPFDVLINMTGASIGRCCYLPEGLGRANVNQHVCAIRLARPNWADARYLSSVLTSTIGQRQVLRFNAGGNRDGLNYQQLKSFRVPWPHKLYRAKIADILSAVDSTIEQTEALIAKTQQIKAGLMHDLFTRGVTPNGELRPPRSEAPQLYKESPLGWIPKEWTSDRLSEYLHGGPKNGYSPPEISEWAGMYALGLGCLTSEGFNPLQLKAVWPNAAGCHGALLLDGDLLISRSNTRDLVGLAGIFRDVGAPCIYPDLMMRILPNRRTSAEYLESLLLSPLMRLQIAAAAVGTSGSMVKLNRWSVLRLHVTLPSDWEQERILSVVRSQRERLSTLGADRDKLRQLKQGLMNDLLTGRVRVPVPETQKAAANG